MQIGMIAKEIVIAITNKIVEEIVIVMIVEETIEDKTVEEIVNMKTEMVENKIGKEIEIKTEEEDNNNRIMNLVGMMTEIGESNGDNEK